MKTRNRFLAIALCSLSVVLFVVGLTACGVDEKCSHSWGEWTVTKDATCTEEGVKERECSECGKTKTSSIEVTGHDWNDATCSEPKTCKNCSATEGSTLGHKPNADDGDCMTAITCSVCGEVTTEARAYHTGGKATCTQKAECSVCGKEYGELAEHEGETVWSKSLNSHCLVYSCCDTQASEPEGHTKVDGFCTVCGFYPTVTVASVEVDQQDTQVEVVISVADNPGITGLTATVKYGSDFLELTEARSGEALSDLAFTVPNDLSSGCTFLWDGVEMRDENIKDGEFLILTFNISEGAPVGEYSILLTVRAYDNDLNPIPLVITAGKIIKNN